MSTEQKKEYTERKFTRINPRAYYDKLQDYFDLMVKEKKCALVPQSKVIGNYAGMTYEFKVGPHKGHWAQISIPRGSTASKPTHYREYDPETKQMVKTPEGKDRYFQVFDAIGAINNIPEDTKQFPQKINIIVKHFGRYEAKQIGDYDQKIDEKARDAKKREKGLTAAQIKQTQDIRESELATMIGKMVSEIENTGTLYGKQAMQVPIRVSPNAISHAQNNQFPSREAILDSENTFKTKNGQWFYQGPVLSGLQYVAAMQDGKEDSRYMLESDIVNLTDPTRLVNNKPKVLKYAAIRSMHESNKKNCILLRGGKYLSPNYAYGKDLGLRAIKGEDGKPLPLEETKEKLGLNCIYIDHTGGDHLTLQRYVNIANFVEKPNGMEEDDHSRDETIYPRYLAKGTNMKGFVSHMYHLYGKCILDKEAFEKNPVEEMRTIITNHTPNGQIKNQGMRALQRELTLDRVFRRAGFQEGIQIPDEDKKAILEWLNKDLENKETLGEHFMNAMTAMDRNNAFLMGASREEILGKAQEMEARPKFKNVQIAMQSDYRMTNGKVLPAGAGGPLSMPLSGVNAYNILRDMCYRDKQLYAEPNNPDYHKRVRFDLKLGDMEYSNVTMSLGSLETGNVSTVSEAMVNLLTKNSRDEAYSRERINRGFGKVKALEEAGLLPESLKSMDRVDFASMKRGEFTRDLQAAWTALDAFKMDERSYLKLQHYAGKEPALDLSKEADVYRYEVPSENQTRLYEALGTSNIIRIMHPEQEALQLRDRTESLVVELRRPLEPYKYTDENGTTVNHKDEFGSGHVTFYDWAESKDRATAPLEAIAFLKGDEYGKDSNFKRKFSLDLEVLDENGKSTGNVMSKQGEEARGLLLSMADRDEKAWKGEKNGQRSVYNMDTFKVTAKWDNEPIFEAQGRLGEKAFSNGRSIEEVLASQEEKLSDKGKAALNEMLENSVVQQKYSPDHDLATAMLSNEPVTEKEIARVLKGNKKVPELDESMDRVDRLEVEARVNMRKSDSDVMNYIVDTAMKEEKARTPEQMESIKAEILKARPDSKELVEQSFARDEVQKKVASRGR